MIEPYQQLTPISFERLQEIVVVVVRISTRHHTHDVFSFFNRLSKYINKVTVAMNDAAETTVKATSVIRKNLKLHQMKI